MSTTTERQYTTPGALTPPPGDAALFTVRCADRARARHILTQLQMQADAPRVAGVLGHDGIVTLVLWFRRPTSSVDVLLLGYDEFRLVRPCEVDLGPIWATGRVLQRLLAAH